MLYKMIYFSSHKFAFSNLRFSPFYEHFRQLCEKYAFKLKIKYIMLISSLNPIWWCAYIWLFLKKTTPPTPLHSPFQNILLTPNPFHCFFAKSLWAGKKFDRWDYWNIESIDCWKDINDYVNYNILTFTARANCDTILYYTDIFCAQCRGATIIL